MTQQNTQPPAETLELVAELTPLVTKASHPNGWEWMFPLRVVPVDGKPTIVSHKGGNLFRGYIATWDEADLLVALANATPRILAALTGGAGGAGGDAGATVTCAAMKQGTAGGNEPADCDWPVCGCDPHAGRVIAALEESGHLKPPAGGDHG